MNETLKEIAAVIAATASLAAILRGWHLACRYRRFARAGGMRKRSVCRPSDGEQLQFGPSEGDKPAVATGDGPELKS